MTERATRSPAGEETLLRLQRGVGALATAAVRRMEDRLAWYRSLSPQDRSWVGLIAQAGIAAFVSWYRRPSDPVQLTADVFGAAPRELTRTISLQQTLELLRTVVDVVEEQASLHAAPGAQQAVRESVLRFSREVAFAAATLYAQAAELRGAWDARLETLVVDALVRGEADEELRSRAASLGWSDADRVAVVVTPAPGRGSPARTQDLTGDLRRHAVRLGADALVGVQGERLVLVLGRAAGDPLAVVPALLPDRERAPVADAPGAQLTGPVVTGPVVEGLADAARSARAALAGLVAVRAWPGAPRPVAAEDLLPERLLSGDGSARRALLDRVHAPLAEAGGPLLDTLAAFLEHGSSVEATARTLYVHANTVRYRLRRVQQVSGLDPLLPRDGFTLQVAVALGRLAAAPGRL